MFRHLFSSKKPKPKLTPTTSNVPQPSTEGRKRRILIVDDSPTEVYTLTTILEQHGYQVISSKNGVEGIAKAKQELPDAILMDIVMPGLNGFQATRQLSKDPLTKHIPIIIVTTKDQKTDRVWGQRQGARDYLTKPVKEEELISTLLAVLC